MTAVNERLLEHYARVAYANLRFGIPHKNIPGYLTDPGKTLIRFGFPKSAMATPFDIQSNMPPINAGTMTTLQSMAMDARQGDFGGAQASVLQGLTIQIKGGQEVWHYDGFSIPFDRKMSGSNEFAWGVEGADGRDIFNRVIRKTPELFEPVLPGQKMPVQVTTACFKSEADGSEALIFIGVPKARSNSIQARYSFFVSDTFLDSTRDKIGTRMFNRVVQEDSTEFFLDRQCIVLPAGVFEYSMEILDQTDQRVGVFRDRLTVPDFYTPGLQMSDLLLATSVEDKSDDSDPFAYKGYSIVPAFSRSFVSGAEIYLFYEIYNLAQQDGRTSYHVEISLSRPKEKRGSVGAAISPLLKSLQLKNDTPEIVTVSYSYAGNSRDERHSRLIDLANHEAGEWVLTIRVSDRISGGIAERRTNFNIRSR